MFAGLQKLYNNDAIHGIRTFSICIVYFIYPAYLITLIHPSGASILPICIPVSVS